MVYPIRREIALPGVEIDGGRRRGVAPGCRAGCGAAWQRLDAFIGEFRVRAPYENLLISGSPLHLAYSTPAAVFLFFLFFVLVNPLLGWLRRRWLFSRSELVAVYIMGAVACTVPTVGLVCVLIPHISAGTYYATPENEWAAKALPYVPSWLRVTDEEAV